MIDVHCHRSVRPESTRAPTGEGCIVSRRVEENTRCLEFARARGLACALFADPNEPGFDEVCAQVERGAAHAYIHPTTMEFADRFRLDPVLAAARVANLPLVVHISRHDRGRMPSASATSWMDYLLAACENLPIVVSHAGGENCPAILPHLRTHPNLFLDLSLWEQTAQRCGYAAGGDVLRLLVDHATPDQFLFGSDRPWPATDAVGAHLVSSLQPLLGDVDVEALLDRNARRALGVEGVRERVSQA